ncbi:MAG: L28 family ribosomal protein [Candidatus Shikimatogenerans sp. Tser]|uniref:Large ribosomal subunit protein bL28 n=1 Tax=Candidatus Shikimatogenerans sp. Tser TaxID=3158568 RepID=A0AAU7QR32_9FLAO
MSKYCIINNKKNIKGNNISKSKKKIKRKFLVNFKKKKIYISFLKKYININISCAGIKTLNKKGINFFYKKYKNIYN